MRAVAEKEGIDLGAYGDVLSFTCKEGSRGRRSATSAPKRHRGQNHDDELVVATRTDGLPDGWALRLHAGTDEVGRGMCYRTLVIRNDGVSGSSAITLVR